MNNCGLCGKPVYGDPVNMKGHAYHVACLTRRAHEVGGAAMEQLEAALQARAAARPETRTGRCAFVNPRTGERCTRSSFSNGARKDPSTGRWYCREHNYGIGQPTPKAPTAAKAATPAPAKGGELAALAAENRGLRAVNARLVAELGGLVEQVAQLGAEVSRLERLVQGSAAD